MSEFPYAASGGIHNEGSQEDSPDVVNPQVLQQHVAALLEAGHADDAFRKVSAAIMADPHDATLRALAAWTLLHLERDHDAAEQASLAIAANPDGYLWPHQLLTYALSNQGDRSGAIDAIERALVIAPFNARNHLEYAKLLRWRARREDTAELHKELDLALSFAPKDPEILAGVANQLIGLGDKDKAREIVATGLAIAPTDQDLVLCQAKLASTNDERADALVGMLADDPEHEDARFLLFASIHAHDSSPFSAGTISILVAILVMGGWFWLPYRTPMKTVVLVMICVCLLFWIFGAFSTRKEQRDRPHTALAKQTGEIGRIGARLTRASLGWSLIPVGFALFITDIGGDDRGLMMVVCGLIMVDVLICVVGQTLAGTGLLRALNNQGLITGRFGKSRCAGLRADARKNAIAIALIAGVVGCFTFLPQGVIASTIPFGVAMLILAAAMVPQNVRTAATRRIEREAAIDSPSEREESFSRRVKQGIFSSTLFLCCVTAGTAWWGLAVLMSS